MPSRLMRAFLATMYLTGVLLTTTVRADALSDFRDLKAVINSAASTVGAPADPSRNWGFLPAAPGSVNGWVNATNGTTGTNPMQVSLDDPYLEYINAIPNLATALSALGRSWHRELNRPVYEAIDALQQSISAFSTSLLSSSLVHTNSTIRTIRASSTLEDAQIAWSRTLNLPGSSKSSDSIVPSSKTRRSIAAEIEILRNRRSPTIPRSATSTDTLSVPSFTTGVKASFIEEEEDARNKAKRHLRLRPLPKGNHYSHHELWGREAAHCQSREGKPRPYDAVVLQKEQLTALRNGYSIDAPAKAMDLPASAPTARLARHYKA
ncbi:uncharacterized protein BDR25DRAFT_338633 [Lindgomyces ingoldianus]|uniref:Uncharacterized protein n=1 Tax=Lindgomyces ingoldianus TaxID=673940 RepID=A0ACB6RGR3_9PLEO|nr:uncharacterized protein BDR25DRAFT_338633 [Lindgomyces ingoldianus]KAF2477925.1 hypothetical protein BDR25DRAFT_338633 [Lindgomyces ingoldianus]